MPKVVKVPVDMRILLCSHVSLPQWRVVGGKAPHVCDTPARVKDFLHVQQITLRQRLSFTQLSSSRSFTAPAPVVGYISPCSFCSTGARRGLHQSGAGCELRCTCSPMLTVTGADLNRDGIPDVLQQLLAGFNVSPQYGHAINTYRGLLYHGDVVPKDVNAVVATAQSSTGSYVAPAPAACTASAPVVEHISPVPAVHAHHEHQARPACGDPGRDLQRAHVAVHGTVIMPEPPCGSPSPRGSKRTRRAGGSSAEQFLLECFFLVQCSNRVTATASQQDSLFPRMFPQKPSYNVPAVYGHGSASWFCLRSDTRVCVLDCKRMAVSCTVSVFKCALRIVNLNPFENAGLSLLKYLRVPLELRVGFETAGAPSIVSPRSLLFVL